MINNDIIILISKFCKFEEYKNISVCNKMLFNQLMKNIPFHIKKEFAIKNLSEYPDKLLELFDPIKLYKTPIIKIKKYGWGDYIDFLNISNFNNNIFLRGTDKHKRPFISFLIDKKNNIVTTLFQRYSEDKYRWVSGGPTPLGKMTIVVDFDQYYKETENIKYIIDFFNNN